MYYMYIGLKIGHIVHKIEFRCYLFRRRRTTTPAITPIKTPFPHKRAMTRAFESARKVNTRNLTSLQNHNLFAFCMSPV